jgi:hypothetical protein
MITIESDGDINSVRIWNDKGEEITDILINSLFEVSFHVNCGEPPYAVLKCHAKTRREAEGDEK